jgi:peptidoglycan/LPS O-acetylase OafA/YrhL
MKDALLPPFVDVAAVCMVYLCTAKPNSLPARVLALRPLRWLGTISYGLYVYHAFILEAFGLYAPDISKPVRLVAVLGTSLIAAGLSWRFIEKPILSFKGRGPGAVTNRRAHHSQPV